MTTPNRYRPHKFHPIVAQHVDDIIRTNAIHHKTSFVVKSTDEIIQLFEEELDAADARDKDNTELLGEVLHELKELTHNTANVINQLHHQRLEYIKAAGGDDRDLRARDAAELIDDLLDGLPTQDPHGV